MFCYTTALFSKDLVIDFKILYENMFKVTKSKDFFHFVFVYPDYESLPEKKSPKESEIRVGNFLITSMTIEDFVLYTTHNFHYPGSDRLLFVFCGFNN